MGPFLIVARALATALGVWAVVSVLLSAIRTIVVSRGESLALTAFVFVGLRHIRGLEELDDLWSEWEAWFADLEQTHTSYPALVYFRSGQGRSWLTSAGTVLDTAAVVTAAVDVAVRPQPQPCLRAGFLALRKVADHFGQASDPDPAPGDPISVTRAEFDACLDELAAAGVPLRADRDRAWREFAGWRVNCDAALIALCAVIEPRTAPWSSDRSPRWSPPFLRTVWLARTSGFRESRRMHRTETTG